MADTRAFACVSIALDCVAGPSTHQPAAPTEFAFAESDEELDNQLEISDSLDGSEPTPWNDTALSDSFSESFPSLAHNQEGYGEDSEWLRAASARVTSLDSVRLPDLGIRLVAGCQDGTVWIFGRRAPTRQTTAPVPPSTSHQSSSPFRPEFPSLALRRVSASSQQSSRSSRPRPRSTSRHRKASATVCLSGFDAFAAETSPELDIPLSPPSAVLVHADSGEADEEEEGKAEEETEDSQDDETLEPLAWTLLRTWPASIVKVLIRDDANATEDGGPIVLALTSDG
jgi:hypothetical protein